ncbi:uncharacterized protein BJX67DRAFT_217940 [Aspergillus lucknowensis]|uniref:Uncharacterized protein n=1 Tax=Aspergillus lucknowensis TaxID=176173 RepID=A0ABR4M3G2_9EURO
MQTQSSRAMSETHDADQRSIKSSQRLLSFLFTFLICFPTPADLGSHPRIRRSKITSGCRVQRLSAALLAVGESNTRGAFLSMPKTFSSMKKMDLVGRAETSHKMVLFSFDLCSLSPFLLFGVFPRERSGSCVLPILGRLMEGELFHFLVDPVP